MRISLVKFTLPAFEARTVTAGDLATLFRVKPGKFPLLKQIVDPAIALDKAAPTSAPAINVWVQTIGLGGIAAGEFGGFDVGGVERSELDC